MFKIGLSGQMFDDRSVWDHLEAAAKYGYDTVFENLSLSITEGSTTVIMGESGCGKTTLLRIVAGLEKPDDGELMCDEKIAMMFQELRLLPWKNALENIKSVLHSEHFSLADKYLSAVGLEKDTDKFPHELSGGMAQRVAFARFLAFAEAEGATLLLLDEPFSSLDDETRTKMLSLLKEFSTEKTLIVVTHNTIEAKAFDNADIIRL